MEAYPRRLIFYLTDNGWSPFKEWLDSLKDVKGRAKIRVRLDRVRLGNFGDYQGVGEGGFKSFVSTTGQVTECIMVRTMKPLSFCCVEEIKVHNPMILTSLNNIGRTIGGDHDEKQILSKRPD